MRRQGLEGGKVGVLLLAAAMAGCSNDPSEPDPVRSDFSGCNVVLISIDTLRADGLKTYNADTRLGERLDRFAQQAVVFEHAR